MQHFEVGTRAKGDGFEDILQGDTSRIDPQLELLQVASIGLEEGTRIVGILLIGPLTGREGHLDAPDAMVVGAIPYTIKETCCGRFTGGPHCINGNYLLSHHLPQ